MTRPTVLALDLEGTLISNAVSQIPRPGLWAFLMQCRELFPRVVVFTTVAEKRFRSVARLLVDEGYTPAWFADIEYVHWQGETKDLSFIPGASAEDALLVDDFERYVHPGQEAQWIRIDYFAYSDSKVDTGLQDVLRVLQGRAAHIVE